MPTRIYILSTEQKVKKCQEEEELSLSFRSLKRRIMEQKQEGDGQIQTRKGPIIFILYKRLNEYILEESTTESVFALFFWLTWNLICCPKNTTTIYLFYSIFNYMYKRYSIISRGKPV